MQDVYSLRCAPQVHGPVREALAYIDGIMGTEINSATDNPLIFDDGEDGYACISGGHFHGQYVAQAMDLLAIADDRPRLDLASGGSRASIDPTMSYGLPRNLLAGKKGLNTGFATVQCSMSALVMENRTLSMPGSVDSIPGKSNAEDHVSNSTWCARKARTIVENVETDRRRRDPDGRARRSPWSADSPRTIRSAPARRPRWTRSARSSRRPCDGDRWYATEMEAALALVRSGAVVAAVEAAIGPLE